MGNDGGYIASRVDLIKNKAKEVHIDNQVKNRDRAQLCKLSKNKLKLPVVMCRLGNLYNYESVIQNLMDKTMPQSFRHIKKLKNDVKQVKLEENKDKKADNPFMCPLSKIEFNGSNKFVGLWGCGCVFAEELIQNLKKEKEMNCPVCAKIFAKNDIVSLNQSEEEQKENFEIVLVQQKKKEMKKEKKQGKSNDGEDEDAEKVQKKVKTNVVQPKIALIQKLADEEIEKSQKQSQIYSKLFHKTQTDFKEENTMFRNTRHGLR
ncbi:hypothetical protein PPERSA_08664 [Pseudocohnilembus persalinus]|uniref:Uncharacterized protein n=1 Tax=Pseudocohnilembus persalinus TaxID=266149 RepID=A0A0V0R849_PSEPJ|nr:hypothetical protein PPERSA_08664 [Pseudocohnilembus persalinus]|eukprot:KRX10669.1 hypothetical protein PPERSA_08664 [Pseudocohnilembus persalinus]